MCEYKLPTSRLSKVLSSDRHTYIQTDRYDRNNIPRRFAGDQKCCENMFLDFLKFSDSSAHHFSPYYFVTFMSCAGLNWLLISF